MSISTVFSNFPVLCSFGFLGASLINSFTSPDKWSSWNPRIGGISTFEGILWKFSVALCFFVKEKPQSFLDGSEVLQQNDYKLFYRRRESVKSVKSRKKKMLGKTELNPDPIKVQSRPDWLISANSCSSEHHIRNFKPDYVMNILKSFVLPYKTACESVNDSFSSFPFLSPSLSNPT